MNIKYKQIKKESINASDAFIIATFFIALIFISWMTIIFIVPPISYLSTQWSDYWEDGNYANSFISTPEYREYRDRENFAENDCETKARKYFSALEVHSFASSTSGDSYENEYKTYDCYGIKYNKIPY